MPVTANDDSPTIDRQALAEQVIVSAGNVLAAAGFARMEIADFFRQAADQLGEAGRQDAMPRQASPGTESPLARVATQFSQHPAVHELHGLSARAAALLPLKAEGDHLTEAFDIAMQAVPLLAAAQQALRTLAQDASLQLTDDAGQEAGCARASDFEALYAGVFEVIAAVAEALARRRDPEAFIFLLEHLANNGVTLDARLQKAFERGAELLG